MRIILNTVIKNTFGKPLRSLLVIFSIFFCALSAMFCFDLAKTEKNLINDLLSSMTGEADLGVNMRICDVSKLPENLPEYNAFRLRGVNDSIYTDIEGEYAFVKMEDMYIYGVDPEVAVAMGYLDDADIKTGEIIITDKVAEACGYSEGDMAKIHDLSGEVHEFEIIKIVKADLKNLLFQDYNAVVNDETADILTCGKPVSGTMMIDIIDNTKIDEAESILKGEFKSDDVQRYAMTEEIEAMMNELYGILFILFAVTFLLVVFITFSICERIVGERMSFIGTLRSLGLSSAQTAVVLLMENVMYALLGSIPGVWLYLSLRGPMMETLFDVSSAGLDVQFDIPEVSIALIATVILSAVLIECLIPLKAVLKALNTSIRDIIFDNRDTEYKFSKSGTVVGIIMCVIALLSCIFGKSLFGAGICLIASVIALALLFPRILKFVTGLITKISEKRENGKMYLASGEAMSRKSTVGSGVLCATSAAMCILIYVIAMAMSGLFNSDVYDCDTIVTCSGKMKQLSFIQYLDGVNDLEYVYYSLDYATIGDDETEITCQIIGLPEGGFRFYHALDGVPESLEEGTVCVEKVWAGRNGVSVGDTIKLTFNSSGVFPIEKEYEVVSFFKMDDYESVKNNFVVSEAEYKSIYHDVPGYILIQSDDPEGVRDIIDKYAVGSVSKVQTKAEMIEENEKDNASSERVLFIVIAVALGMTCVGMVTNQLIGFEGRKKECAVMVSTSMSKRTLSGILIREMLITSVTAVTSGTIIGLLLIAVIKRAVENSESVLMYFNFNPLTVVLFYAVMIVVFTLTTLFPIKNLKKMKLSEQLKYE
ncbi:MAG: FtsX-like permease family protein [Lachnospiraceae bacterium]|nr:FtsX-like permease family protein [Lachnospiraceae bacterium]